MIALAGLPPSVHPWPVGVGPRYHPTAPVRDGKPVGALLCGAYRVRFDAHVEIFASRRVAILPRGIGRGPACAYAASTNAPTGVIRLVHAVRLGDLFRVWGQPLGPRRLLSFRGTVTAYVGGRRWPGDPRRIWLTRHAQVVLEVGGHVAPHPAYLFPKGTP
ncbi:MAG TPA: hypothetical protein VGU02_10740 [Gaiellaceae bacterium]|nr:hypothetical protein [Gaiellaceae bacterium]